jgi:F-type H+-transporting ATPase subunit gamma
MANLKEVRNRITSVNSTRQITSAMKLVSAAKLRRAQDAIVRMRPYAEKLREILDNLSQSVETSENNPYTAVREEKNILLVVVTSNRGLCGAFNANVINETNKILTGKYAEQKTAGNVSVITVGKKASTFFQKRTEAKFISSHDDLYSALTFDNVKVLAESVMSDFASGKYDKVYFIYNKFITAATQQVLVEQFLPVVPPAEDTQNTSLANNDYIFEPSKEEIVETLIPTSLKTQFFKVLLDSHAAEHGARMTAMHKATDNAGDLLKELKLTYNKERQAAITNEILEIVAGAEALES